MALVTLVHSIELYFKAKLLEINEQIIFNNSNTRTININKLPKLLEKYYNIQIDTNEFSKMIKIRNNLVHSWLSNWNTAYETLYFWFTILIPTVEKYFPKDLEAIFEVIWYWDECIFEDYLLEQLDSYNISYSQTIKKRFSL